jgi:hypothetical protein
MKKDASDKSIYKIDLRRLINLILRAKPQWALKKEKIFETLIIEPPEL